MAKAVKPILKKKNAKPQKPKRLGTMASTALEAVNFLNYTKIAHARKQEERKILQKKADEEYAKKRQLKKAKALAKQLKAASKDSATSGATTKIDTKDVNNLKSKVVAKNDLTAQKALASTASASSSVVVKKAGRPSKVTAVVAAPAPAVAASASAKPAVIPKKAGRPPKTPAPVVHAKKAGKATLPVKSDAKKTPVVQTPKTVGSAQEAPSSKAKASVAVEPKKAGRPSVSSSSTSVSKTIAAPKKVGRPAGIAKKVVSAFPPKRGRPSSQLKASKVVAPVTAPVSSAAIVAPKKAGRPASANKAVAAVPSTTKAAAVPSLSPAVPVQKKAGRPASAKKLPVVAPVVADKPAVSSTQVAPKKAGRPAKKPIVNVPVVAAPAAVVVPKQQDTAAPAKSGSPVVAPKKVGRPALSTAGMKPKGLKQVAATPKSSKSTSNSDDTKPQATAVSSGSDAASPKDTKPETKDKANKVPGKVGRPIKKLPKTSPVAGTAKKTDKAASVIPSKAVPTPLKVSAPTPAKSSATPAKPSATPAKASATPASKPLATPASKAVATPASKTIATPAKNALGSVLKVKTTRAESKLIESGLAAGMIDAVFCIDTTGSMDEYLQKTKDTISKIVEKVKEQSKGESVSVRFGVVAYRDHPPQEITYVTKEQDLSKDKETLEFLETLDCQGGGDGAEAVFDGLLAASQQISWRDSATLPSLRYIFHITDAPPHGKKYKGYSEEWDNGCPCGIDVNKVAHIINIQQIHYRLVKIGPKLDVMAEEFKEKFTNYEECAIDNAIGMDIKITDMIIRELLPDVDMSLD